MTEQLSTMERRVYYYLLDFLGLGVNQFNALSAGIILGVLVTPTIATLTEDAMSAVPASLREGSVWASKARTSIVPSPGCGRMSHQISPRVSMMPDRCAKSTKSA